MGSSFHRLRKLPAWRRISLHAWRTPQDPTAYGTIDLDVTAALCFLEAERARTGVKVTLTHLVGKAVADAIKLRPEVNAVIRRGHAIYQRDSIDVFFQVAYAGGEDLSGAKVPHADTKSLVEIAQELQTRAERVRARTDEELTQSSELLAKLPGSLRGMVVRSMGYLQYDLGLDLSRLGLPQDAFGSVMVTNVGVFGLDRAFAPLVPFSRAPIVITVGAVEQRPWAVGDRVEVRPVLSIGAAVDHRLVDGYQMGQITRRFREVLQDPAAALGTA